MKIIKDTRGGWDISTPDDACKGVYFRYLAAGFSGKKGRWVLTQELRLLKSQSCPGCSRCFGLVDDLNEGVSKPGFLQFEGDLQDGDKVYLKPVPVSFDRETGQLEEWYYEVHAVKPAKPG